MVVAEVPPEYCDTEVVQNVLQERVELPFHILAVPAVLFSLLSASSRLSLQVHQTVVCHLHRIDHGMRCGRRSPNLDQAFSSALSTPSSNYTSLAAQLNVYPPYHA